MLVGVRGQSAAAVGAVAVGVAVALAEGLTVAVGLAEGEGETASVPVGVDEGLAEAVGDAGSVGVVEGLAVEVTSALRRVTDALVPTGAVVLTDALVLTAGVVPASAPEDAGDATAGAQGSAAEGWSAVTAAEVTAGSPTQMRAPARTTPTAALIPRREVIKLRDFVLPAMVVSSHAVHLGVLAHAPLRREGFVRSSRGNRDFLAEPIGQVVRRTATRVSC
jgi:hypothetical protein